MCVQGLLAFVDIETKVPSQYSLLILKLLTFNLVSTGNQPDGTPCTYMNYLHFVMTLPD